MPLPSTGVSPGEHKLVTLLYATLPPALGTGLDLDALYERLHGVETFIRGTVEPYGGVLQHLAPDRVAILFGAPIAYEDHAQRAVLAAWALGQQWPAHAAALGQASEAGSALRMGVHTGLVVVETAGASPAVPTTVVGDVPTVAAALAQRAMPGTILVSAATARLVEAVGHLEALPPLAVAGQSDLVAAYRVVALGPPPSLQAQRGERGWSPLPDARQNWRFCTVAGRRRSRDTARWWGLWGSRGSARRACSGSSASTWRRMPSRISPGAASPMAVPRRICRCSTSSASSVALTVTDDPAVCRAKVEARLQALGLVPEDGAPFLLDLLGVPRALSRQQC